MFEYSPGHSIEYRQLSRQGNHSLDGTNRRDRRTQKSSAVPEHFDNSNQRRGCMQTRGYNSTYTIELGILITRIITTIRLSIVMALFAGLPALIGCSAQTDPESEQPSSELVALLGATDFVIGENRIPFAIYTQEQTFVPNATVQAQFFKILGSELVPKFSKAAVYRKTEASENHVHSSEKKHLHTVEHGIYTLDQVLLDESGFWAVQLDITYGGTESVDQTTMNLEVRASTLAIGVGELAPPSENPVDLGTSALGEISTMVTPVLEFYDSTIAGELEQNNPFVVAFASPAFCVSRMCGPVMDIVAAVHKNYDGPANFIHIEPYKLATVRETGRLELTTTAEEWRLPTEPWVFLVGSDGTIKARLEGLFSEEELENLLGLLKN